MFRSNARGVSLAAAPDGLIATFEGQTGRLALAAFADSAWSALPSPDDTIGAQDSILRVTPDGHRYLLHGRGEGFDHDVWLVRGDAAWSEPARFFLESTLPRTDAALDRQGGLHVIYLHAAMSHDQLIYRYIPRKAR